MMDNRHENQKWQDDKSEFRRKNQRLDQAMPHASNFLAFKKKPVDFRVRGESISIGITIDPHSTVPNWPTVNQRIHNNTNEYNGYGQ